MTHPTCENTTSGIERIVELLNDLYDALEENAYTDEAKVVLHHIEQLKSPQTESRVLLDGINHIMEELSEGFSGAGMQI